MGYPDERDGIWEIDQLKADQQAKRFEMLEVRVEARPGTHIKSFFHQLADLSTLLNTPVIGTFNDRTYPAKPGMTEMDLVALQLGDTQKSKSALRSF